MFDPKAPQVWSPVSISLDLSFIAELSVEHQSTGRPAVTVCSVDISPVFSSGVDPGSGCVDFNVMAFFPEINFKWGKKKLRKMFHKDIKRHCIVL